MTLEEKVKAAALLEISRITKEGIPEVKVRYIRFPLMVDCVVDFLTYDKEEQTWEVDYFVGKGEGTFVFNDTGWYDDTEKRTIKISL